MENSLLGFFAGIMLSFMVYLICKEDPKPHPYQKMLIEKLEYRLQKEQTKNEIYKILLECKK